jgi:hypothetical protein
VALIAAQPTATGKTVRALNRWDGRLWLSYGDTSANTGPIHALTLDLANPTGITDQATLTTEATSRYRPFGGNLYVVFDDPQGGIGNPESGSYAWTSGDGTWHTVANLTPYPEHVGDIAITPAGILVGGLALLTDGGANQSQIWHSTDGGSTWASESVDTSGAVERLFVFSNGRIMAYQGTTFKLWDGTAWSNTGIGLPSGTFIAERAVRFVFNGDEFYLSAGGVVTDPGSDIDVTALRAAYADVTSSTVAQAIDVSEDGLHLYVMKFNGDVLRYDQTGAHALAVTIHNGNVAASIAVDEEHGLLWYGTTDSRLCAVTLP